MSRADQYLRQAVTNMRRGLQEKPDIIPAECTTVEYSAITQEPIRGVFTALNGDLTVTVPIAGYRIGAGGVVELESIGGVTSADYRIRSVLRSGAGVAAPAATVALSTPTIESIDSSAAITVAGEVLVTVVVNVRRIAENFNRKPIRYEIMFDESGTTPKPEAMVATLSQALCAGELSGALSAGETGTFTISPASIKGIQVDKNFPLRNAVVKIGSEEILCDEYERATGTFTGLTRGYNGTSAVSHANGDMVLSLTAAASAYLKPNTSFTATTRALAEDGRTSNESTAQGFTTAYDVTPPAVPTGLQITLEARRAIVEWNENTETDFSHYILAVSREGGAYTNINAGSGAKHEVPISPRETITVKLAAVDRTGNQSSFSATVSATAPAEAESQFLQDPDFESGSVVDLNITTSGTVAQSVQQTTVHSGLYALRLTSDRSAAGSYTITTSPKFGKSNYRTKHGDAGVLMFWVYVDTLKGSESLTAALKMEYGPSPSPFVVTLDSVTFDSGNAPENGFGAWSLVLLESKINLPAVSDIRLTFQIDDTIDPAQTGTYNVYFDGFYFATLGLGSKDSALLRGTTLSTSRPTGQDVLRYNAGSGLIEWSNLADKLDIAGDTMTGALSMGNHTLSSPADPTAGTHVGDRDYNDARYVNSTGDTMTGDLVTSGELRAGSATTGHGVLAAKGNTRMLSLDTTTSGSASILQTYRRNGAELWWLRIEADDTISFAEQVSGRHMLALERTTGYTGMGTVNPRTYLHLVGGAPTIRISDDSALSDSEVIGYIEYYRGNNASRVGWVGFGSATNDVFTVRNEISGADIYLNPNGGYVGANTSTPGLMFEVYDADHNAVSRVTSGQTPVWIDFVDSLATAGSFANRLGYGGDDFILRAGGNEVFRANGNTQRLALGLASASFKFDVLEDVGTFAARIHNQHGGGDGIIIRVGAATPTSSNIYAVFQDSGGGSDGTIVGDGAGGVNYNSASSERMKQDMVPVDGILTAIGRLRVVNYRGLGGYKRQVGLVAEDVEQVLPTVVQSAMIEGRRQKTLDYGRTAAVIAVRGLQEANALIIAQQAAIDDLKQRVTQLEAT